MIRLPSRLTVLITTNPNPTRNRRMILARLLPGGPDPTPKGLRSLLGHFLVKWVSSLGTGDSSSRGKGATDTMSEAGVQGTCRNANRQAILDYIASLHGTRVMPDP